MRVMFIRIWNDNHARTQIYNMWGNTISRNLFGSILQSKITTCAFQLIIQEFHHFLSAAAHGWFYWPWYWWDSKLKPFSFEFWYSTRSHQESLASFKLCLNDSFNQKKVINKYWTIIPTNVYLFVPIRK